MKYILLIAAVALMYVSCEEEKFDYYTGEEYIRLVPSVFDAPSFKYERTLNFAQYSYKDTVCLIDVEVIGGVSSQPRQVKFEQMIVDESQKQAMPGVLFVPFDDPAMLAKMILPADSVRAKIPIRVLCNRDTLNKYASSPGIRLNFKIVESEGLKVLPRYSTGCITLR